MERRVSYIILSLWVMMTFGEASAMKALTNAEIELLKANNFTVAIDEERSTITLEHAGIPDHDLLDEQWGNNPNTPTIQDHSYTLPLEATVATVKGCAGGLGPIGFAVSGAVFYNPYNANGVNAVHGDCKEDLDECWGHPDPHGTYHYHQVPECLYNVSNPDLEPRDMFLGVALDGYPIYGPMNGTNYTYTTADLDQCHGHTYKGRYMYRATSDFPYIISCFHGNDVKNIGNIGGGQTGQLPGGQRPPPTGGQRPPPGDGAIQGNVNNGCNSAEVADWQTKTCIVVCENAGRDLSNCPSRSKYNTTDITDPVDNAVSVVPSLALIAMVHSLFSMLAFC